MASWQEIKQDIRERGLGVVKRHLRHVEDPSRLKLVGHPEEEKKWASWSIYLNGEKLCYIGVGNRKGTALITFEVDTKDGIGAFHGAWRYGSYEVRTDSDVQAALAAAGSDDLFADGIHKRRQEIVGS